MSGDPGTLAAVATALGSAAQTLADELTPTTIVALLAAQGITAPDQVAQDLAVSAAISDAATQVKALITRAAAIEEANGQPDLVVAAALATLEQIPAIVDALNAFSAAIRTSLMASQGVSESVGILLGELALALLDEMLIDYMIEQVPWLIYGLAVVGLAELRTIPADPGDAQSVEYTRRRLRLDRINDLIRSPADAFADSVGWNTPSFDPTALLSAIDDFLYLFGFLSVQSDDPATLSFYSIVTAAAPASGGLEVTLAKPFGPGITATIPLSQRFQLVIAIDPSLPAGLGLSVSPPHQLALTGGDASGAVTLSVATMDTLGDSLLLIGQPGATSLSAKSLELGASLTFATGPNGVEVSFGMKAEIVDGLLVIALDQADGFLSGVLGTGPVQAPVNVAMVWSYADGLTFAPAGVNLRIPVTVALGPGRIEGLVLSLNASDGTAQLSFGADLALVVGPVSASLTGFGLGFSITPASGTDKWSSFHVGLDGPTGAGLAIDATSSPEPGSSNLTRRTAGTSARCSSRFRRSDYRSALSD